MQLVPIGGLCNRLRAILSHLAAARAAGVALHVYWTDHPACPARFTTLFEPIAADVHIYEGSPVPAGAKITCENHEEWPETRWQHLVDLLRPLPDIQTRIDTLLESLGPTFTAVHIRRTDHNSNYDQDMAYTVFDGPIYAAADNPRSLATLKCVLGDRLTYNGRFSTQGIRMSSVADAVVDLWVSSHSINFKGTFYSSFTDFIEMMRRVKGLPKGSTIGDLPSWAK
jgi:hypothetical protein